MRQQAETVAPWLTVHQSDLAVHRANSWQNERETQPSQCCLKLFDRLFIILTGIHSRKGRMTVLMKEILEQIALFFPLQLQRKCQLNYVSTLLLNWVLKSSQHYLEFIKHAGTSCSNKADCLIQFWSTEYL